MILIKIVKKMTKSNIFDDHLTRTEHSLSPVLLFYFLVSSTSIEKEKTTRLSCYSSSLQAAAQTQIRSNRVGCNTPI